MRTSWFLILSFGQLALVRLVLASDPEWVEKSFRPDSAGYVYTVGVGIGTDELSALREARRHALASFLQSHLAQSTRVAVRTVEGNSGVLVDDRTSSEVYRLDLTKFEKVDQRVVSQELPIRQYTVKSLYRFPKTLLAKYRESMPGEALTRVDDEALSRKLAEAKQDEDEREKARIEGEAVYSATYPFLGLEFSLGYLKVSRYSFLAAGFGLPIRLRLLSDRLVIRPFFMYGFGDSNTVAKEQSNDTDSPQYTTALSLGVDARLFLGQSLDRGIYLVAQGTSDRVNPTCPKANTGKCVGQAENVFTKTSYSAGVGYVVPNRHPIAFELLYGVPDHRIGIQFHLGLPLLK